MSCSSASSPFLSRLEARNRGSQKPDNGAANHAFSKSLPVMVRPAPEHIHRDQLSRRQLERLRCQHLQIHGQSNQSALRSARIVQVSEHPLSNFNDQWLLTETRHQGQQPSILVTDKPVTVRHYRNQFTAIPWSTVFRPALKQTRPSIPGYQSARVLGPAGQPAVLDDRGRIQVRLWPTAETDPFESASLWLPVAFAAPDGRIDPSSLPKAGSDVLISFLDSDPDRPVLCVGMGHHPRTRPVPKPRRDSHLLLDWLVNRSNLTP